jgi:hypothetical protein
MVLDFANPKQSGSRDDAKVIGAAAYRNQKKGMTTEARKHGGLVRLMRALACETSLFFLLLQ